MAEAIQKLCLHVLLDQEVSDRPPVLVATVAASEVAMVVEEASEDPATIAMDPVEALDTKEVGADSVDSRRQTPHRDPEVDEVEDMEVALTATVAPLVATVNLSDPGIAMTGVTAIEMATAETETETATGIAIETASAIGTEAEMTEDERGIMKTTHTMTRVLNGDIEPMLGQLPLDQAVH